MKIKPLIGIDKIVLGSSKETLFDLLGEPESSSSDEWPDGTISEAWKYPSMGIVLNFDSDTDYRLSTISVTAQDAELDGINPIGLNINTLIDQFPTIVLDEDLSEAMKDYVCQEREISFWAVNGVIEHMTLFPEYGADNLPIWPC
jgi:hypothetical protein